MQNNLDETLWPNSRLVCGLDEAGRGALAGPVIAGAVVLPQWTHIEGVDDSKKLPPPVRTRLFRQISQQAIAVAFGAAGHLTIDRINIRNATLLAMRRAVQRLDITPDLVIVDGPAVPELNQPSIGIVRGDQLSLTIASASIIAKVIRDRLMERLDRRFPGYGFARHKGYATPEHLDALARLGPCPFHRQTFHPCIVTAGVR